ncbi:MAG: hypothetical protein KGQ41_04315 [Alphaproteobacteria bacterium]|nr:hypothetical protein [Alphaproteobacteria bacterium]
MVGSIIEFLKSPKTGPYPLFEAAVAASRNPIFYRDFEVPDTFDGRFDALLLHLWPIFRAIEKEEKLGQGLYDLTFKRMELALRETGVGDLAVGKQVRAMMQAFYGRLSTYTVCTNESQWREALRRNLYGTIKREDFSVPDGVVRYAIRLSQINMPLDDIKAGKFTYPAP